MQIFVSCALTTSENRFIFIIFEALWWLNVATRLFSDYFPCNSIFYTQRLNHHI